MGNYHYIVAGLPELTLQFEKLNFNFEALHQSIKENLTLKRDQRLLDWLFFGLTTDNLNSHFYRAAKRSKSSFIRNYFNFDREIRNIQAAFVAREEKIDPTPHLVGSDEITEQLKLDRSADFGLSYFNNRSIEVLRALERENIVEREQQIDALRWNVINEINIYHYFSIDTILGYLVKCSILQRWQNLDKERGTKLFNQLLQEVRGTYQLEENY